MAYSPGRASASGRINLCLRCCSLLLRRSPAACPPLARCFRRLLLLLAAAACVCRFCLRFRYCLLCLRCIVPCATTLALFPHLVLRVRVAGGLPCWGLVRSCSFLLLHVRSAGLLFCCCMCCCCFVRYCCCAPCCAVVWVLVRQWLGVALVLWRRAGTARLRRTTCAAMQRLRRVCSAMLIGIVCCCSALRFAACSAALVVRLGRAVPARCPRTAVAARVRCELLPAHLLPGK